MSRSDKSSQSKPETPGTQRNPVRDPLGSGYSVEGIDLPDSGGRPVRRLDLPPLAPMAESGSPGAPVKHDDPEPTQAMPLPIPDRGADSQADGGYGANLELLGEGPAPAPAPANPVGSGVDNGQSHDHQPLANPLDPANLHRRHDHDNYDGVAAEAAAPGPVGQTPNQPDGMIAAVPAEDDMSNSQRNGTYQNETELPGWTAQQSSDNWYDQSPGPSQDYPQGGGVAVPAYEQVGSNPQQDGGWVPSPYPGGGDYSQGQPSAGGWDQRAVGDQTGFRGAPQRAPEMEPRRGSGWLLGLGVFVILTAGGVGAYFLTRPDKPATDTTSTEAAPGADSDQVTTTTVADTTGTETTTATTQPRVSPTGEPLLVLEAADAGPLSTEEDYPLEVLSPPEGVTYQVVVDDTPQGSPFEVPPVLQLPQGHHRISVEMIAADGTATPTNAIDVHVVGPTPPATGYRVNLASVSMEAEGWTKAVERYNSFEEAGHANLRLTPSDPYPSMVPGYWNIYVDGFGEDSAAATAYCEQFGLAVPDECFVSRFDANDPAPAPAPASDE